MGLKVTAQLMGSEGENIFYLERDRSRTEVRDRTGALMKEPGPMIVRCDLEQTFWLNLKSNEYVSSRYPDHPTPEEARARGIRTSPIYKSSEPVLRIEKNTRATGERKEFFGRTAHHVIITQREIPLGLSRYQPSETITDEWVLDVDRRVSCQRQLEEEIAAHHWAFSYPDEPIDRTETINSGKEETGIVVEAKSITRTTRTLPDGTTRQEVSCSEAWVTELKEMPLDPSLFEVPAGFTKADSLKK